MVIRKLYRIESAHIVRDAVSKRCSHSYHGHSGVFEVFFKSNALDAAGMVYDFGAMKKTVGSFIDMFDHAVHLWNRDEEENIEFFTQHNARYIILPFNPTAENYALFFKKCVNQILNYSHFSNSECGVYCSGVRYHETVTGYAESEEQDTCTFKLNQVEFSDAVLAEATPEIVEIINKIKIGEGRNV